MPARVGRARRLQASFAVRQEPDEQGCRIRRPMTQSEEAELSRAIEQGDGQSFLFGVVKLSLLQLDGEVHSPNVATDGGRTLLQRAGALKRYKIASALLRAGADPTVRFPVPSINGLCEGWLESLAKICSCSRSYSHIPQGESSEFVSGFDDDAETAHLSKQVQRLMCHNISRMPLAYSVWILCQLEQMREAANVAPTTQHLECHACDPDRPHRITRSIKWLRCGHVGCEHAMWRQVCSAGPEDPLHCPECGEEADEFDKVFKPGPTAPSQPPLVVKAASFWKWTKLPTTLLDHKKVAKAKSSFTALPLWALQHQNIGTFQGGRTEALLLAAVQGRAIRVEAIVEAGCDVNATNEYGQTAVFLAALHGHAKVVRVLGMSGADVDLPASGGCRPMLTAQLHNSQEVIEALQEAGTSTVELKFSATDDATILCHLPWYQRPAATATTTTPTSTTAKEPAATKIVNVLIPEDDPHVGAGSFTLDDAFGEDFLRSLVGLWASLPVAPPSKPSCSDRSYYCDSEGWIQRNFEVALRDIGLENSVSKALPHMRFLHYGKAGGYLCPHTDLSRTDAKGRTSTHTFILYLEDCASGGETSLLERMPKGSNVTEAEAARVRLQHDCPVLASVSPKKGRLLVFPHNCPHEGLPVVDVPKLLLRGELY